MNLRRLSRARAQLRSRAALVVMAFIAACAQSFPAWSQASLPVDAFAGSGIATTAVRAASAGRLEHLPAHVQVPNDRQRHVAAPLGGLVTEVRVGIGDPVSKGEVLARILSPELLGLQRELAQASAERERSALALARDERLFAEGLIAGSRIEATRAVDRQAQAAFAEKRSLVALAGVRAVSAGVFDVIAPIDGVVLAQEVHSGQRVEAATPLFHVARLDQLELRIDVPIDAARRIVPGAEVRIARSGAAGQVIAIGRGVGDAQTVVVRARLEPGAADLGPGQHVEAVIDLSDDAGLQRGWRVPAAAVVRLGAEGTKPAVFAQRGDRYMVVPVDVIGATDRDVVVQAQLHENEPVVSAGASQLKAALGASDGDGDGDGDAADVPAASHDRRPAAAAR